MRIARLLTTSFLQRHGLSWCRMKFQRRLVYTTCMRMSASDGTGKENMWDVQFKLKDPELNLSFLLNPKNREFIKKNIADRKGVGNIDRVLELYEDLNETSDDGKRELLRQQLLSAVVEIPNMSHPDSPVGDEDKAKTVDTVMAKSEPDHGNLKIALELAEDLGHLRTRNVSQTTGSASYYFLDKLVQLEQALIRYTFQFIRQKGFELISVPDLLRPEIIEGCGFKTTGEVAQVYRLDPSRHPDLCLAGTSEMGLAGYFADSVLQETELPMKLTAVSRCYRAETSHAEADLGIYRVHHFTKVEMFAVTKNETGTEGDELLKELVDIQKTLFSQLGLHFRVLDMPTTELGASAHRKFDIEAWLPGKQMWGEISSASNCTDYQSRRLHIKYQNKEDKLRYCTTVNGTACAVPRTILALLETYQEKDGSIAVPEVLQPFMDDITVISKSEAVPKIQMIKSTKLKKVSKTSSDSESEK